MKKLSLSMAASLVLACSLLNSNAALKTGAVYCDANTNRMIDSGDIPVANLLIVVTNLSGTFSNYNWTAADGSFAIELLDTPDEYIDFIHPLTLPPGTTDILPAYSTFLTVNSQTMVTNFFLLEGSCSSPPAPVKLGHVYCDANTNGVIDPGDSPVSGALVVVTNSSGTYSNAASTDAQGFFSIDLPPGPDLYGDYLVNSSLPAGTTVVIPGENQAYQFSIPTLYPSNIVTNDFLVQNPACVTVTPPANNLCWLTGGGTIRTSRGRPTFTFGTVVNPGCDTNRACGGAFNLIWHTGKLQFKATRIHVLNCGNLEIPPTRRTPHHRTFNYIDFEGVGTLKGISGNRANYGTVRFSARAVDAGEPGRVDQLYLRVFDGNDQTLVLISSDSNHPEEPAPTRISTGNLQIHVSGCNR